MTCTVEGYPLNNVRWYFNQVDFNIETEIKSDQFHKVDNIFTPDSIKSMLVIRNVNPDHFGNYKIRVEGGNQEIVERMVSLEQMLPEGGFNSGMKTPYSHLLIFSIHVVFVGLFYAF